MRSVFPVKGEKGNVVRGVVQNKSQDVIDAKCDSFDEQPACPSFAIVRHGPRLQGD